MSQLVTRFPVICAPAAVIAEIKKGLAFLETPSMKLHHWFLAAPWERPDTVIEFRVLSWRGEQPKALEAAFSGERDLTFEEVADCDIFGTAIELNGSTQAACDAVIARLREFGASETKRKARRKARRKKASSKS